jgi:hypothetical protein
MEDEAVNINNRNTATDSAGSKFIVFRKRELQRILDNIT